jgi:hypothetical protein
MFPPHCFGLACIALVIKLSKDRGADFGMMMPGEASLYCLVRSRITAKTAFKRKKPFLETFQMAGSIKGHPCPRRACQVQVAADSW